MGLGLKMGVGRNGKTFLKSPVNQQDQLVVFLVVRGTRDRGENVGESWEGSTAKMLVRTWFWM